MADSDFLVTLPSNSNMKTHPDNEPANYTVKLAGPINLTGDWEVALVSLQYTPTWLNIQKCIPLKLVVFPGEYDMYNALDGVNMQLLTKRSDAAQTFYAHNENDGQRIRRLPNGAVLKETQISAGYYESSEALGKEFCRVVEAACVTEKIKITYFFNRVEQIGSFRVQGGLLFIAAVDEENTLNQMLGTDVKHEDSSVLKVLCDQECKKPDARYDSHLYEISHHGNTSARAFKKVSSLWVYTNISAHQYVGDTKAPLLSIIPASGAIGQRTHFTVNPVNYLPVTRDHISEIQIQIVDDKGTRIPFDKKGENGACCLRFRRRKNPSPI